MTRTLLCIHGAFVGGWVFDPLARYFRARGWRCLAPDLRHHHAEADPEALSETGLADYLADLTEIAAALDEPPVVVGHSMGGLLAQQLAARGLARAMVLLAPAPPWGVMPSTPIEMLGRAWMLRQGPFWRGAVPPRFDVAAEGALDRFSPAERIRLFHRFVPESGRALFELLFWPLDPRHAAAVPTTQVRCPVLLGVGDGDRVISPATVRSIARKYPSRSTYVEFKGHSHYLFGEPGFDEIPPLLEAWLENMLALA